MSDADRNIDDVRLERFLDGQLSAAECDAFRRELSGDANRHAHVRLQERIDRELAQQFAGRMPADEHVQQVTSAVRGPDQPPAFKLVRTRRGWLAGLAAAAVGGALVTFAIDARRRPEPFFQATPLVKLYQQAVAAGFEPYYECRDDERFAAVFAKRLATPLQLLPMPAGSRMLGLSYPGGLSRDTTAMLCMIDEEPVMVFVDRLAADDTELVTSRGDAAAANVFRHTLDNLVIYEVSPWQSAKAAKFLTLAAPQAGSR